MVVKREDIQKILYSFANMKIDKKSIEHNTLLEPIGHHPKSIEKIGVGVDYFFVQQSKWKTNQYNFMICRLDGTITDFSFYKCLQSKNKHTNWSKTSKIFRCTIKDQTDLFRKCAFENIGVGDKFICSQTNLKFKKIYSHIDHVYPLTFDSILLEFIKLYEIDCDKIPLSEDVGTSEPQKILDNNVVTLFSEFHKKRSVLRVVYSICNLQSKKTKNYNGKNPEHIKKVLLKKYPQYHIDNEGNYIV